MRGYIVQGHIVRNIDAEWHLKGLKWTKESNKICPSRGRTAKSPRGKWKQHHSGKVSYPFKDRLLQIASYTLTEGFDIHSWSALGELAEGSSS